MTIDIFVLKGDLNRENRSGAFLFLLGIYFIAEQILRYLSQVYCIDST